ncbi:phosphoadenylyl-sulfate reductase [Synechococcus sp. RSCCF101]|uniref:phosphoadenylyl-sulfate reductase n=1 Tax=Synechococcus sp. RSCCF101 TaxID=2511069 RepID=UPI001CD9210E|nr:phosphoadenylyl-sulfate reductase [Synechococcus sp. RSCCF101]
MSQTSLEPASLRATDEPGLGELGNLRAACEHLLGLPAEERLRWGASTFAGRFAITTSFGIQSAVSLHMASSLELDVPVLWVDTGYLPPETYRYAETLRQKLGFRLEVAQSSVSPARMEALHGRLWATGRVEDLEEYHRMRKVEPLDGLLQRLDLRCWASGVRGGQTDHRSAMKPLDRVRGRWSLRPLLDWSNRDVYYYMERHGLPQHPLFEKGYSTVGDWHSSGPDTGTASGRDTRFGGLKQECGIHLPGEMGDGI